MTGASESFLSLHAVRVFVRDLDRSLRFYLDQLGFRLVIDTRLQSGERWVAVSPPDGTAILTLVAPRRRLARAQAHRPRHAGRARHRPTWPAGSRSGRARACASRARRGCGGSSTTRRTRRSPRRAGCSARRRRSGAASPPAFATSTGTRFSLVSFDEVTHAVEAERRAAAEKLRGRASRRPRARDRPAGAGPALPAVDARAAVARVRGHLPPGARRGRRLLRLPEPRARTASASSSAT